MPGPSRDHRPCHADGITPAGHRVGGRPVDRLPRSTPFPRPGFRQGSSGRLGQTRTKIILVATTPIHGLSRLVADEAAPVGRGAAALGGQPRPRRWHSVRRLGASLTRWRGRGARDAALAPPGWPHQLPSPPRVRRGDGARVTCPPGCADASAGGEEGGQQRSRPQCLRRKTSSVHTMHAGARVAGPPV